MTFALTFWSATFASAHDAAEAPSSPRRRRHDKDDERHTVKPTGDVDRDFRGDDGAASPGAIDMGWRFCVTAATSSSSARPGIIVTQRTRSPPCASRSATAAAVHWPLQPTLPENKDETSHSHDPAAGEHHSRRLCLAGQARGCVDPDVPVSHRDRVYAAEQFSNTVSGDRSCRQQAPWRHPPGRSSPGNLSPLYKGQVLVHRHGFFADRRTLAVVSIGSNSVNLHRHGDQCGQSTTTYVGAPRNEAFFTPDGSEVWSRCAGRIMSPSSTENIREKTRITTPAAGMQIFSPDGKSAMSARLQPRTVVISVADHQSSAA